LGEDEWNFFEKDFLFLSSPRDTVVTETGVLIMDPQYFHKLYVKGFWIADLKEDGLYMGVNLFHMELDR
jgi:hypothetical protein